MNTGYRQWLREWRITVIPKGGGIVLDVSDLRCAFHVEKQLKETPNYAQVVITNLAVSTIGQIKPGDKVTVEAGYRGGNFGLIFSGEVVQPYIEREQSVDINLILVCQDGDAFINQQWISKTLEKGATADDVVNACAKGDGVTKGQITSKISVLNALIRGKTLFGKNSDYLKRTAYAANSQFYVEDGEINIIGADDYKAGEAVELNPDTGLIGDPSQTDDGVSAKCLINPSIKLNTLVHISPDTVQRKKVSKSGDKMKELAVDGLYRVSKIVIEGDTHGDDWYYTIDAVAKTVADGAGSNAKDGYTTDGGPKKSVLTQAGLKGVFDQVVEEFRGLSGGK